MVWPESAGAKVITLKAGVAAAAARVARREPGPSLFTFVTCKAVAAVIWKSSTSSVVSEAVVLLISNPAVGPVARKGTTIVRYGAEWTPAVFCAATEGSG